jgi:mannose-6-phosphate isomerase-like protein (cupin superfamily)
VIDKVNLAEALSQVQDHWTPRIVAAYNDETVQVLKVQGEFVWHRHEGTDDLFLVLSGAVTVQLRDGDIEVGAGELFVVPRGIEHCLRSETEAEVLVIERLGDVDAGFSPSELLGSA